jgi:hypothetical protein
MAKAQGFAIELCCRSIRRLFGKKIDQAVEILMFFTENTIS